MNKLTFATVVALTLSSTLSATAVDCLEIHAAAKSTANARQVGVPLPDVIAAIESTGASALKPMVFEAYGRPQYRTDSAREDAVRKFADKWYLMCLEANE